MSAIDLNSLSAAADLTDATDRAMLADAYEEAGRDDEAELLRLDSVAVHLREGEIRLFLDASAVEGELERLGVACDDDNPTGVRVYFDDEMPAGWCRISDDYGSWEQDAAELLAALRDIPSVGEEFFGDEDSVAEEQYERFSRALLRSDRWQSENLDQCGKRTLRYDVPDAPEGWVAYRWLTNGGNWAYGYDTVDTGDRVDFRNPIWQDLKD